ncbi:MAG: diacylglycerol kinase family protein [Anaerolineaceae bacterium]|nr:diacylglycerol kinase family protein [Anaerolineaceae bacterium]
MIKFLNDRLHSFKPALEGLKYVLATQKNAWLHLAATGGVLALALWLKLSRIDFAILFLTFGLVWAAECFNTSVETFVNLVSPERKPLAKIAKDVGAAGVLCAAIVSIAIGILVFFDPLLTKLQPFF